MAAPTVEDVAWYTSDRLDAYDEQTTHLLSIGLSAARRFCGWHVTGVREDEVTLDGPGSAVLALPTLRLVELVGVVEDGTALAVTELFVSSKGLVRKKSGGHWSSHFGSVTVTMNHGFADADDFNAAVLAFVDRTSQGGRPRVVGPFQYDAEAMGHGSFSRVEQSLLEQYRLESRA